VEVVDGENPDIDRRGLRQSARGRAGRCYQHRRGKDWIKREFHDLMVARQYNDFTKLRPRWCGL
jgi:hypothetical protein